MCDRNRRLILLGAGASVEAGVPSSRAMTAKLLDIVRGRDAVLHRALTFVTGGLQFQAGLVGGDPLVAPDVELVFATVSTLSRRSTSELAPFVSAWHEGLLAIEDSDFAFRLDLTELKAALARFVDARTVQSSPRRNVAIQELAERISCIGAQSSGSLVFSRLEREMLRGLRTACSVDRSGVGYLAPLIDLARKQVSGLVIATLNYDQSIEMCSEGLGCEVDTGIRSWQNEVRLESREGAILLLKLHGSLKWVLEENLKRPGNLPDVVVRAERDGDPDDLPRALVFGAGNKLRADGPFLDLLDALGRELTRANEVIIVGYSFRDDHVNAKLRAWFNGMPGRIVVVIDPDNDLPNKSRFLRDILDCEGQRAVFHSVVASSGLASFV